MKTITSSPKPREVETPDRPVRPALETPAEQPNREFTGPQVLYRAICLNTMTAALVFTISGSIRAQTPVPTTSTHSPTTTQNQGWMLFDDKTGTILNMDDEQVQQLREVDGSYQKRYTAAGNTHWTNEGYNALYDSREKDYLAILTPAQYEQWNRNYGRGRLGHPKRMMRDRRNITTTPY